MISNIIDISDKKVCFDKPKPLELNEQILRNSGDDELEAMIKKDTSKKKKT